MSVYAWRQEGPGLFLKASVWFWTVIWNIGESPVPKELQLFQGSQSKLLKQTRMAVATTPETQPGQNIQFSTKCIFLC